MTIAFQILNVVELNIWILLYFTSFRKPNGLLECCIWRRPGVQFSNQPNLAHHCKQFATSTQIAVLTWRYGAELEPTNSFQFLALFGEYIVLW